MSAGCLILEKRDGWRLVDLASSQHEELGPLDSLALAETVDAFVKSQRIPRGAILLAAHSTSVIAADFDRSEDATQRDRTALGFAFETQMPLPIEALSADFHIGDSSVLGAGVVLSDWQPIVDALEDRGLQVQSVTAAATLALQALQKVWDRSTAMVVWQNGSEIELFRLQDGHCLRWNHLPAGTDSVAQRIAAEALSASDTPEVLGLQLSGESEDMFATFGISLDRESLSYFDSVAITAGRVLSGTERPLFEFRRDALASADPFRLWQGPLSWLFLAACLLLCALVVAFQVRTHRQQQRADELFARQEQVFKAVFPDSRVPSAIGRRLESELRDIAGQRQPDNEIERPVSAIGLLYQLISALPTSERWRVKTLRLENGVFELETEIRSFGSAGKVVEALERAGFRVAPPSTEQVDNRTVSARLEGRLLADEVPL